MKRERTALGAMFVGWKEWVVLPELGIRAIQAKVDTGARTSCLHAFKVEPFDQDGVRRVRFSVHPVQGDNEVEVNCVADVVDEREVTDSGGHTESRLVISTPVIIGGRTWPIEMTLTNRDTMTFRMLLGRTALRNGGLVVNPDGAFLTGAPFGPSADEEEE